MKTIFKTQFGSHVYGTNLPSSDTDYKSIFIPSPKQILLQRDPRTINKSTKEDKSERNSSEDIDDEQFSLQQYLKLLVEGQTVSLDMLFTPKKFWIESSNTWEILRENKDKLLHKGINAFVGYTKAQAAKYGVKGFRVAALRETLEFLKELPDFKTLLDYELFISIWVENQNNENISVVNCKGPNNSLTPHLQVCNRKIPFYAKVKYAKEVFQKIFDEYGARALLAEKNEGVDWKALMHAVRVAREAEELLLTGEITFPRPEKDLLLQIRKGELQYKEVAEVIEQGLLKIEEINNKSILPEKANNEWIEDFIYSTYLKEIK